MIKETNYAVFDFETSSIEKGLQKFVIGALYYDGYFIISESIDDILNGMIQCKKPIIYAHNMLYDFRFLLKPITDRKLSFHAILTSSDVISIKVMYKDDVLFELRDSFCLFRSSLEDISNAINTEYKKKKYKYIAYAEEELRENRMEFIHYLKLDCLSLFESIQKFYTFLGYDLRKDKLGLTIAGIALKEWKKRNKTLDYKLPKEYDHIFRSTYFGGRTEVFIKEFLNYDDTIYYYDFNSLYPSVMKKYAYPHGNLKPILNESDFNQILCEDIDFIAKVRVKIPNQYISNCPHRDKGKLYFISGEIEEWFNSVEIRSFIENKYKVEFIDGYYFTKKSYYFLSYVDFFYDLRMRNKGTALDRISKLMLNSLSGKFAQKDKFDSIEYIEKENLFYAIDSHSRKGELVKPLSDNFYNIISTKEKEYSTSYISSFITSYARKELFDLMKSINKSGHKVFYCDTDSVFTTKKIETGKHLGCLKLESEIEKSLFLLPKFYSYTEKNYPNKSKVVIKGLLKNKITGEQVENLFFNNTTIEQKRTLCSKLRSIARGHIDYQECIEQIKEITLDDQKEKRIFFNNTSRAININELYNKKLEQFDKNKIKIDDTFDIYAEKDRTLNKKEQIENIEHKIKPNFKDFNF